ncbi:uncharacterized protein LOC117781151 [Drosophila innubila]|uniref:uncharacterized protein LOC117781151 n=1 Tax=Drosophila innubila TaxID=198719 RepID=UPI00148DA3F4|nr:uncharacterized protein LOC117781151 [Drosophila innubila]
MRIILVTVSLALLVIVSAVPVSNFKDELKDAAEQTFFEINSKYREYIPTGKFIIPKLTEMNEFAEDRLAEFQSRATEMIRVAKEAGYTDDFLDELYDKFAEDNLITSKSMHFVSLLNYLNGVDL